MSRWICIKCGGRFPLARDRCPKDGFPVARDYSGTLLRRRFKLERIFDAGGMGSAIWDAIDTASEEPVAVKIVGPMHRDVTERFIRGSRLAVHFNHANCTRVFSYGKFDGEDLFLVMERLYGGVLYDLQRDHRLSLAEILEVADQTLTGLAHIHEHGAVHRDVKPANLFLTQRPAGPPLIKILDYGIAIASDDPSLPPPPPPPNDGFSISPREGRKISGTPFYMAPEQILGWDIDARTDIYAMGVLLFQLVTGQMPFPGETPDIVYEGHLHAVPRPFSELCPGRRFPAGLELLVRRALRKKPEARFEDALAMRRMLRVIRNKDHSLVLGQAGLSRLVASIDAPTPGVSRGAETQPTTAYQGVSPNRLRRATETTIQLAEDVASAMHVPELPITRQNAYEAALREEARAFLALLGED